jgi:VanZ family protein
MLKHIKNLLKENSFIIASIVTVIILCLSLIKLPQADIKISNIDKVYHSIAYFTLAIAWLIVYYKKPNKKYIIVICCIIFGIVIEVLQSKITVHRTGDYYDILANSSGVLFALLIFNLISKKKQIN